MGSYGRNGDFLQTPIPQHRLGRGKTGNDPIQHFAPVNLGTAEDPLDGRRTITVAAADSSPLVGKSGVIIHEEPWQAFWGHDRAVTDPDDIDFVPAGKQAQVCHGTEVRIWLKNTTEQVFGSRTYAAKTMVASIDSLAIDDELTPGAGNTTAGFWKKTTTPGDGWLRVTGVHPDQGLVEAQMLF